MGASVCVLNGNRRINTCCTCGAAQSCRQPRCSFRCPSDDFCSCAQQERKWFISWKHISNICSCKINLFNCTQISKKYYPTWTNYTNNMWLKHFGVTNKTNPLTLVMIVWYYVAYTDLLIFSDPLCSFPPPYFYSGTLLEQLCMIDSFK